MQSAVVGCKAIATRLKPRVPEESCIIYTQLQLQNFTVRELFTQRRFEFRIMQIDSVSLLKELHE